MANVRNAFLDYMDCILEREKVTSLKRRCNIPNLRISFRINWIVILTVTASILFCQFAESVAKQQASSSHEEKDYNQRCLNQHSSLRRSMTSANLTLQSIVDDPAIASQDILSRLEAAAILRDNLVTALGRMLLLCLDDDARVPFELIHDAIRSRRVAVYELLPVLPALRNKLPKQQLYNLLQMLERVDNRFVSEYTSLCINIFNDISAVIEQAPLTDMLWNINPEMLRSISLDKHSPLSLTKDVDSLLRVARNDVRTLNLRVVAAILMNYPAFDLTDPEIHDAINFVAERMRERSRAEDPLLWNIELSLENAMDFLRTVLERLEVDELSSKATQEAISLLLQNLDVEPYPVAPTWEDKSKILSTITNNYYPINVTAVAKYLANHLDDSHFRDLDIGFYETGDQALLQTLSRLRRKSNLQHFSKPLSLLTSFVSQKLAYDSNYAYTAPISQYEVNNYLDTFDTLCLQQNVSDAMKTLRSHLSDNLPWTYAFGDKRASDDPRELTLLALTHLRSIPISKPQAIAIDNFVYKSRAGSLTGKRSPLYDSGVIFQRDDSTDVEIDLFSLLMRIPNAFKSEKFTPMLNFLSKPNILDILGYEFNKFEYETPRSLLLGLLKRALSLASVKSDEPLFKALQNARNYLEEPLLINLYTSDELQLLLEQLPGIENEPRYLPLKLIFNKKRIFAFLSPSFSLAGVHTPKDRLLLILRTLGLKMEEASANFLEALSFALNNIDGPPLKIKTFDRTDFIYLIQQQLFNESLQNEILKSSVYMNVNDWNISISGTPENILARVLSYPVKYIASDGHLASVVKQAVSILEEKDQIDIEILNKRTLEAMLEYLPNNTYVKPVILVLKKANLMTIVPKLNLSILENASPRDALIMLLRYFIESNVIRTEKLLLRRVRAALSTLDGNNHPPQTSIYAYLIQSLQDPSNVVYKPLLREVNELRNVTVLSDERQVWLQSYLEEIIAKNKTRKLTEAALMTLKEIGYDEYMDEEARASKARISEALSFLPIDSFAKPLRKLLTSEWAYSVLPEKVKHSSSLEKEELLIAILYHAKRRTDIANNPALMKIISNVESKLNGWKTKVEMLKSAVAAAKAATYDSVRDLLTASGLNRLRVIVPFKKSTKLSLLTLLHHLLKHSVIQNNNKIFELLSAIRQDVLDFGVDEDLLTVLDEVGIAYTSELAPVRLFLHNQGRFNDKFARIVFPIADPIERYRTLLSILWKQNQINNDTRLHDALLILRNIKPVARKSAGTLISDLEDVINSMPHQVKPQFKLIEQLFNIDLLSRFTHDNEIVESKKPLTLLLSKMASLPEVRHNHTAARELTKLQSKVEKLLNRSIFTGYQLRPLLVELKHVQQINIDYLNSIIDPEVLNYLNPEEFSDISDDNTEILSTILDYLLYEKTMYADYNMRKHLQSLKRALALTTGPSKTSSKRHLNKKDWEKMLILIPRNRDFAPIKILLQSEEIYKYIPKDTNWKIFSTPVKKLLHLLSLIESSDIENKNVYKSLNKLRENLEKRFNFVTERDVKIMHHALTSLKLKYDLVPLKIFLNHDNLIKYLPPDFKYTKYGASINGLAAVLDIFLQSSSLKQRKILYQTMIFVRESIRERVDSARRSSRKIFHKQPSAEDLEFISSIAPPKLSEFLKPEKLLNLLPQSFSLDNRPTFKMKALHLLQQLLQLNITDVHSELEKLVREVETYPDVPNILQDDLAPLLNILPIEGIPHIELIKKYLRPLTLIELLPGNFIIKQTNDAKSALHNVLLLLSKTLGSAKDDKLKIALDALTRESAKINSNVIPEMALVNNDDIKSIIEEIPFEQYKQIEPLKTKMTVMNVVSSLPMNFQLTNYNTKKLRVLAVLNELSKNKEFKPILHSVNFAKRIVSKMPNMPVVNDTEIERLILPLPLNVFYVKDIITNCKLAILMPYLPIHFNLASLESRKMKIAKILHYCKVANPTNMSMKQALTNAETSLKSLPDFDVTSEHIEVLLRAIPCTRFTMIKPLLRFLSMTNIESLLPWDLDVYRTSRTFKLRILDLLAALRNVKKLQNGEMFTALDYLEINTKSLPENVNIPQDRITVLNDVEIMRIEPCVPFRDFVSKTDNLIQILPPNYRFQTNPETVHNEWALIIYMSSLFLRDVKMDGAMKNVFKACVDNRRRYDRELLHYHIIIKLMTMPYVQFAPLRLHTLIHANTLTAPIENVYRGGFLQGTIYTMIRVMLREYIRRPELIGSKSVIDDMEVFLHDYVMLQIQENKTYHEEPTPYDIDLAINEIPSDRKYDDLKVFLRCQKIETPVMRKNLSPDDTPKQLLIELLKEAESGDIDDKIRKSIEILKPDVAHGIREEEVEYVLKQLRDYRYHVKKLQTIRKYLLQVGLQSVLMNDTSDFCTAYPTYKQRLYMLNERLLQGVPGQPKDDEFQTELKYLNRTLYNEIKIDRIMPRTIDDINMNSLFLALPKTKDERLIRGIIKFFSIPDLLRRLNLPKDPFEYVTKGQLLEVIMDLGQELESVQQDPVQQEALEYFRDKIRTTGTGTQPIELKKDVFDSNMDVDTYGLMRAIDYTKVTEKNAMNVATFLEYKYDRLVYGLGFNHLAYATRGVYLKALFEHLVNVSQVPEDIKTEIKMMMPAVNLDGLGEEGVDLNVDVVHEESTLHSKAETPVARFGAEIIPRTFQEDKDSLKAAIYNMLESIPSSEEENPTGQKNIYNDEIRGVIDIPQHSFDVARRRWNSMEDARNLNSSLEEMKRPSSERSTKVPIANDAKTKRKKNDRSSVSLLDDIFEIPVKHNKTVKKGRTKSKKDSSRRSNNLGYLSGENANSSIKSQKGRVNSFSSRNSLSEELPEKSRNRKHHELSQRISQPDISTEYDEVDRKASIIRMLRNMLVRDEENLSLIKELLEDEMSTGEKRRTVKKDLSRRAGRERRDEKEKEKYERRKVN
ncbi:uncharacterized protein LOC126853143 isoform X2 [Cataglyphis hispanica]|uniref:uncharacterized protein LOC126853143 isoform X2 n=1 Tax=Cataglyphis hispanica TaxID=1086592 RepID=UPI0021804CD0|nr:uncharacterized protein LOC126853143 isoform X2 [Cataglyphis hispanica]